MKDWFLMAGWGRRGDEASLYLPRARKERELGSCEDRKGKKERKSPEDVWNRNVKKIGT